MSDSTPVRESGCSQVVKLMEKINNGEEGGGRGGGEPSGESEVARVVSLERPFVRCSSCWAI